MEGFRKTISRGFLVISLLLNLIFVGAGVIFFKTHALDLPLVALIINKNCDQGLDKLFPLPNLELNSALSAKFCQSRPAILPKQP